MRSFSLVHQLACKWTRQIDKMFIHDDRTQFASYIKPVWLVG